MSALVTRIGVHPASGSAIGSGGMERARGHRITAPIRRAHRNTWASPGAARTASRSGNWFAFRAGNRPRWAPQAISLTVCPLSTRLALEPGSYTPNG